MGELRKVLPAWGKVFVLGAGLALFGCEQADEEAEAPEESTSALEESEETTPVAVVETIELAEEAVEDATMEAAEEVTVETAEKEAIEVGESIASDMSSGTAIAAAGDAAAGGELFNQFCVNCHGDGGAGLTTYNGELERLQFMINGGSAYMPDFTGMFTDDEIANIHAYLAASE